LNPWRRWSPWPRREIPSSGGPCSNLPGPAWR